jgi:hypothetical protein
MPPIVGLVHRPTLRIAGIGGRACGNPQGRSPGAAGGGSKSLTAFAAATIDEIAAREACSERYVNMTNGVAT